MNVTLALTLVLTSDGAFAVSATAVAAATEAPRNCIARAAEVARAKALDGAPREVQTLFVDAQSAHDTRESQFVHSYTSTLQKALVVTDKLEEKGLRVDPDGTTHCEVVLRGRFLRTGAPDHAFQVRDIALNQPSFFPGQEAQVSFRLTDDAYVYVLAVDEKQNVTLVFPNAHTPPRDHYVKANVAWTFPSAGDRARGIRLRAALPEGAHESVELLQVIAAKDAPALFSQPASRGAGPFEAMSQTDMNNVVIRLGNLERRMWTTATSAYTIRSR